VEVEKSEVPKENRDSCILSRLPLVYMGRKELPVMNRQIKELIGKAVKSHCSSCKLGLYAEKKPNSPISKIWHWHAKWCPMRKAYLRGLAAEEAPRTESPTAAVGQ
jgi:hypothetical protein